MNRTEPASYQEFVSLPARVVGILRRPRAVFRRVIERPNWIGVAVLTFFLMAATGAAFMATSVGRTALVDQWERSALAFGQEVSDDRYASLTRLSDEGVAYAVLSAFAAGPLLTVVAAGAIYGLFGRRAPEVTFTQVLAVAAHAAVILAARQVVVTPLNYARESLASPATLGLLLPMLDEASPVARFAGAIDLFVVWWVIVLAIGVSLLYRRPARTTAFAFMGAYVGFAAVMVIAMVVSGGTA